ncbi:MAG: hypothetical protein DRH43_02110 [Deltaproteobacteria bacterium]|nr:MAG: hypothetical protein DRH43_02110 [Deltaproteobacteria bacterium]
MIIIEIIVLISLIGFMAVIYYYQRDVIYPAFVFCFIWTIQIAGLIIFQNLFIPLSPDVLLIVLTGILFFTIGCFVGSRKAIYISDKWRLTIREIQCNKIFHIVAIIILLWALWNIYLIASNVWSGDSLLLKLISLRKAIGKDRTPGGYFGIFSYFSSIVFVLTILAFFSKMKADKKVFKYEIVFYLYLIIFLGMSFFSTGRGNMLKIFIVIAFSYIYLVRPKPKKFCKVFFLLVFFAFFLFWSGGILLHKGDNSNFYSVLKSIALYQFSPLPALSIFLQSKHDLFFGQYTFRFFPAVLKAIGFDVEVKKRVLDFVHIPNRTNIYTFYYSYISDFGVISVGFFPFIIGLIHGQIYKKALLAKNNDFIGFIFVVSFLPLLNSTGGEAYFSMLSTWIQYLFFAYIFTRKMSTRLLFQAKSIG